MLSLVPETKRLTLEEMDIVFGASGVAEADRERMAAINREVGLERFLQGDERLSDEKQGADFDEKTGTLPAERNVHLR